MATEKISEIFDIQAIQKQTAEVIKKIESVATAMEASAAKIQACNSDIVSSNTFEELSKATGKFVKVNDEYVYQSKELAQLQKTQAQLEQKRQISYIETAKRVEKLRQEVAEETQAIKSSVKAQREKEKADNASVRSISEVIDQLKRQRNSVTELNAENKRLRELVRSMDYNTQASEIAQINSAIDANTAIIQLNSDAYVKQKMNIGNYQTAVQGLDKIMTSIQADMKRVADAGGEQSEEFQLLRSEFEKAKAKSEEYAKAITTVEQSSVSLKQELRDLKEQMAALELSGQSNSEAYEDMKDRAVELTQSVNAVNDQIKNLEAPTATFDSIMGGLQGVAGGFEVWQGAMGFCNLESEEFEKIQAKVQSAIAITNGLTSIASALDKDQAFMVGLKSAAQSKNIIVSKAAAVVQKALNVVMNNFPLILLISALMAGTAALANWLGKTKEASEEQKRLNEVSSKAVEGYASQKIEIDALTQRIKSGNATRDDQAKVIKTLNDLYGENYTKGKKIKDLEDKFIEDSGAYIKSLELKAQAQAAFDLAAEKQKEALKVAEKTAEDYTSAFERMFNSDALISEYTNAAKDKEKSDLEEMSQNYIAIGNKALEQAQENAKKKGFIVNEADKDLLKKQEEAAKKQQEFLKKQAQAQEQTMLLQWQRSADNNKSIYEDEKQSFGDRYTALETYVSQQEDIINEQSDFQIRSTKATGEEKILLEAQAQEAVTKLHENAVKEREKLETQETTKRAASLIISSDKRLSDIQKNMNRELATAARQYAKGEMSEEDYQKIKLQIQSRYEEKILKESLDSLQKRINLSGLEEDEKKRLIDELQAKENEYFAWKNQKEIENYENTRERLDDERKKRQELATFIIGTAGSVSEALTALSVAIFERKIQQIDIEIEKIGEQKEAQLAAVEEMDISAEEREARKEAIEKKAEKQREQFEKKKKQEQLKQAKAEKANALIQATINTALSITSTAKDLGFPAAIPFIIAAGVLGAVQIAAIAAQPLPQYARGTEDHPGGLAIVGDGGKQELALLPGGEYYVTPSVPTIVDLPKHTEILPDFNLALRSVSFTPGVRDDAPNHSARVEQRLEALEKAIKETTAAVIQNRPQFNINLDKKGLWEAYERQKGRTTYINERLNIRG